MKKPSRITTPRHAHPVARLFFDLLRRHRVTYLEAEHSSGILVSTIKSWRTASVPSFQSLEAALGIFGWRLVPCPPLDGIPDEVREQLESVGQHFVSDDETLAAAIVAATTKPGKGGTAEQPAPRLEYRNADKPYWAPMEQATA